MHADGNGPVSQCVQDIHRAAQEVFGEALPAVVGMGEKFGDEGRARAGTADMAVRYEDGGGDPADRIEYRQGGLRDGRSVRSIEDPADPAGRLFGVQPVRFGGVGPEIEVSQLGQIRGFHGPVDACAGREFLRADERRQGDEMDHG